MLEGADAEAWADFVAGFVAGFDCALLSETKNIKARATPVAVESIRFLFMDILLYCGFFSFFAG